VCGVGGFVGKNGSRSVDGSVGVSVWGMLGITGDSVDCGRRKGSDVTVFGSTGVSVRWRFGVWVRLTGERSVVEAIFDTGSALGVGAVLSVSNEVSVTKAALLNDCKGAAAAPVQAVKAASLENTDCIHMKSGP
jgi:hypothetical protein